MAHPPSDSPVIDAHQHFWRPARGDYDWMTAAVAPIRRDLLPDDLAPSLARHGIGGTVLVQAAATVAETEFLLTLAAGAPFVRGVVGWVDLAAPDVGAVLDRLAANPRLKGVRPMLQDIEETGWILRPEVVRGLRAVAARGLRFDALIQPRHLAAVDRLAALVPDLSIIIDHCAKPVIAGGAAPDRAWHQGMARLAARPNVTCKLSGLANEAGPEWDVDGLRPVVDHVLGRFGAARVMWGSDWPVLTLVGSYDRWRGASMRLLAGLSPAERAAVFGGTAAAVYGLEV